MKIKKILKGVMGVALAGIMSSCSSDYLDIAPVTSVSDNEVVSTVEGARSGYYGVLRSMYMQYSGLDGYMFFNGEGWVDMFYGDVMGQDYVSLMWQTQMGNINYNWDTMTRNSGWQSRLLWMYCYNLISQCNKILAGIDDAEGNEQELKRIKAGLLTVRAHAYVHLVRCYGPRWDDSNNGSVSTAVIREPNSPKNVSLSTNGEILQYIYSNLDEALALYKEAGIKRAYNWEPNENVAMGIYARAALLRNDWQTAQKMAHDARQGFDIMTWDQYKAGFAEANQEWMWNNAPDDYFMYYWATGSLYACNGAYATIWQYGAGAISLDLYRQLDPKDKRRDLFWTPDKAESYGVPNRLFEDDFFLSDVVDPATMNCNGSYVWMQIALEQFGKSMIPNGDEAKYGIPYTVRSPEVPESERKAVYITIGAQYKFWGLDYFGTNSFPFMRGSEMLLTEAEAAYHNGDMATAKACLNELNSKRIDGYACNSSGEALLNEIKLSRRIELWGEGHSWFDLKRWGDPMVRTGWEENNVNSGNYPAVNAMTKQASDNNGWRYAVPRSESDYNTAIDLTK